MNDVRMNPSGLFIGLSLLISSVSISEANTSFPFCKLNWDDGASSKREIAFKFERKKEISVDSHTQILFKKEPKNIYHWSIQQYFGENKSDLIDYTIECNLRLKCSGFRVSKVKNKTEKDVFHILAGNKMIAKIGERPVFNFERSDKDFTFTFIEYSFHDKNHGMELNCHE